MHAKINTSCFCGTRNTTTTVQQASFQQYKWKHTIVLAHEFTNKEIISAHAISWWQYCILVYTTQVNSAFHALWLVNSEVISKYYSPPSSRRKKFSNFRPLVAHETTFWFANYSTCVVYTKTIIHLSVGESDGYLPPLFTSTYVNNCLLHSLYFVNRPYSYSRHWPGTSLQMRLMLGSLFKCKWH